MRYALSFGSRPIAVAAGAVVVVVAVALTLARMRSEKADTPRPDLGAEERKDGEIVLEVTHRVPPGTVLR